MIYSVDVITLLNILMNTQTVFSYAFIFFNSRYCQIFTTVNMCRLPTY